MIRRVCDERIPIGIRVAQRVEDGTNRVVEPREAGSEDARDTRLLKIRFGVEPLAVKPRVR